MSIRTTLAAVAAATTLAACGSGGETLDQTGATPELPKIDETLLPPMKIARPQGWNGELPTVPAGSCSEPPRCFGH